MSCNFHVGQKVVCVDDLTNNTNEKLPEINAGHVYVIRRIGRIHVPSIGYLDTEESLWLEGVDRHIKVHSISVDLGFRHSRFRPAVTRKTDISIFKAMLNPSKQRISA
jgi:hypothetical protein